jgi:1,4-alpha-glucan branching enzyme
MPCLALVLELHHPLPDAGAAVGTDWSWAAIETYWPILRALHRFAEDPGQTSVTLAVSPSWMALADDPAAQARVRVELETRLNDGAVDPSLHRFVTGTCESDALRLLRRWNAAGTVDVIPTTASHTWLPSVALDPIVARAQFGLAAADCAKRLEARPTGVWLPFLGYAPGLESAMAESGLRFFGVGADVFVRGTVLPPGRTSGPLVTPPGVAAFGVEPSPTAQAFDPQTGYGRDPRYADPAKAVRAAFEHSRHFVDLWRDQAFAAPTSEGAPTEPIRVVAFSAHDLARSWPSGGAGEWLAQILERLKAVEGASATSLDRYLARNPIGPLGRPGTSPGGMLAARPADSDLFDRCRTAADLLTFVLEQRATLRPLERRTTAWMVRSLLRAQQVDWEVPFGRGVGPDVGLERAKRHLALFHELAGGLMSGKPDPRRLDQLDRGPAYLPEIDLNVLAGG